MIFLGEVISIKKNYVQWIESIGQTLLDFHIKIPTKRYNGIEKNSLDVHVFDKRVANPSSPHFKFLPDNRLLFGAAFSISRNIPGNCIQILIRDNISTSVIPRTILLRLLQNVAPKKSDTPIWRRRNSRERAPRCINTAIRPDSKITERRFAIHKMNMIFSADSVISSDEVVGVRMRSKKTTCRCPGTKACPSFDLIDMRIPLRTPFQPPLLAKSPPGI